MSVGLMAERTSIAGGEHRCPRDWTALPGELLASIRGRLPPADFASFAAVCTAWRRTAPSVPAPQLPWLLFPLLRCSSSDEVPTCRFFSPSEGRTYLVHVPELRRTRCVGSCEGWVASFDEATAEMALVNPLTRARIPLPPLTAMPHATAARDEGGRIFEFTIRVNRRGTPVSYMTSNLRGLAEKLVVSSKPTDAACKLAAILVPFFPPASISVGGEMWKPLAGAGCLLDIVYDGRDGKYCGLNYDNSVFRWGTDADDVGTVECCPPLPDFPKESCEDERHLVVHRPSGDLLLAFINFQAMPKLQDAIGGTSYEVEAVKVFRFKRDDGSAGAWRRLDSLSGSSLFLGRNGSQSICLSAQDIPELRADCIFFIGQEFDCIGCFKEYGLWVYDLKEGILEPFCPDWRSRNQKPLWFTPNLS